MVVVLFVLAGAILLVVPGTATDALAAGEPPICLPNTPWPTGIANRDLTARGLLETIGCVPTKATTYRPDLTAPSDNYWALGDWPLVNAVIAGDLVTFSWSAPSYPAPVCVPTDQVLCTYKDAASYPPGSIVPSIMWPASLSGSPLSGVPGDYSFGFAEQYQDHNPVDWEPKGTKMTLERQGTCGVENARDESVPGVDPPYIPTFIYHRGLTAGSCTYRMNVTAVAPKPTSLLLGFQTVATTPGGENTTGGPLYLNPYFNTDPAVAFEVVSWGGLPGCWPDLCTGYRGYPSAVSGLYNSGIAFVTIPGPAGLGQLHPDFTWNQKDRTTLHFDASGSTGASFVSYEWKFGPNPGDVVTEADPLIDRSFSDAGTRDITLTVTTTDGRRASVTKAVDLPGLRVNAIGDAPESSAAKAKGICDTGALVGDQPECTLRAAIDVANSASGADTILFKIAGPGVHSIAPGSPLPPITDATIIDATSQPTGAIELSGTSAGAGAIGLQVTGATSTVKGLTIGGFGGAGIELTGGPGHQVVGNIVGLDQSATSARPNGTGIDVHSPGAIIGTVADPNVVSGNTNSGVLVAAPGAHVAFNRIGTNAAGTAKIANRTGVSVDGTSAAEIGPGNVISGNSVVGVLSDSYNANVSGVHVHDNIIGLSTEDAPLGNGFGVLLDEGAGCCSNTGTVVENNTISANIVEVLVRGGRTTATIVRFNKIGTTSQGLPLGVRSGTERQAGVRIDGAVGTRIENNVLVGHAYAEVVVHGRNEVTVEALPGSSPSGDPQYAIKLNWFPAKTNGVAPTGHGTVVTNNEIGTAATGAATDTVIGVLTAFRADDVTVGPGNTIGNATATAVAVANSTGVRIVGNRIGQTSSGAAAPNQVGVNVIASERVTIGGAPAADHNVIASNTGTGIQVRGNNDVEGVVVNGGGLSIDNVIQGNTITSNRSGILVVSGSVRTTVGGTSAGAANVITGNGDLGMYVGASQDYNGPPIDTVVVANRIGVSPAGAKAPNGNYGIQVGTSTGTILDRNLVHGTLEGIVVADGVNAWLTKNKTWGASTSNLDLLGTANGALPAPELVKATSNLKDSKIEVNVPAGGPYEIELFSSGACSSPPEAREYLGTTTVATGANEVPLLVPLSPGTGVTATITSADKRTSELSACVAVALPANLAIIIGPHGETIVLTGPTGSKFVYARAIDNPNPATMPKGATFPLGMFEFMLTDVSGPTVVDVTIPDGTDVKTYLRYGPKTGGTKDWYDWKYDPVTGTGAEMQGTNIRLHFVDGGLGDDDGKANGTIVDPAGPALIVATPDDTTTTPATTSTSTSTSTDDIAAMPTTAASASAADGAGGAPAGQTGTGSLPLTGGDSGPLVLFAGALIAVGGLLLRRERSR